MANELQSAKIQANQNREDAKLLLNLLQLACKERDEARDQLQKLMFTINSKIIPPPPLTQFDHDFFCKTSYTRQHGLAADLMNQVKVSSSITESRSTLSETQRFSSPIDSSVDFYTINSISSDSANTSLLNQPLLHDTPAGALPDVSFSHYSHHKHQGIAGSLVAAASRFDQDDLVIYNIVKGKALPKKGRLLQAVMTAGPLLETLMVAGPLPRWRDAPPVQKFRGGSKVR